MASDTATFPPDLSRLTTVQWVGALRALGEAQGFCEPLGPSHLAAFVERGDTLMVGFESIPGIQSLSPTHTPLALDMAGSHNWSALSVLSTGDTWFRHRRVYEFFDQLTDDGFFDDFDTVLFYGAGPCGYAAAAFSVACPGARVLVLQPQATLDPRVTEWDDRFTEERRRDFTSRYGFAPEMLDGALRADVLYDPREPLDAMHSALFKRPAVQRHRLPFMGATLQSDLRALDVITPLLEAAADGTIGTSLVSRLMRARRTYPPYLRRLLARLDADDRHALAEMLCINVTSRMHAPRFARRLAQLRGS